MGHRLRGPRLLGLVQRPRRVQPGAEITVGFFLADMSDANWSTVALLDAFRWDCEGCVPNDVDDCGIKPQ
ncbi:hypothetical protein [Nannocystis pusilla]|uniref:hypothetical protein n=1 Tax=Nannocystis pusilla TaxID=889268 RepID=UPI003B826C47